MNDCIHVFRPALGGKPVVLAERPSALQRERQRVQPYLLATPKLEAADDLYEALKEAIAELDAGTVALCGEHYNNPKFNAVLARAEGKYHE